MTEIGFHFNIADKVQYAARLIRKAGQTHGMPVVVVADSELIDAVDAALWSLSPTDFVAHCRVGDVPSVTLRSTIVLAETAAEANLPQAVLINLGRALPSGFERFERLFDVVSDEAADRQLGRARWRHYADRGYAIKPHDGAAGAKQ